MSIVRTLVLASSAVLRPGGRSLIEFVEEVVVVDGVTVVDKVELADSMSRTIGRVVFAVVDVDENVIAVCVEVVEIGVVTLDRTSAGSPVKQSPSYYTIANILTVSLVSLTSRVLDA